MLGSHGSRFTRRLRGGGLILALAAAATAARAVDRNWDGSSSQVWNTAANWTPAGVPTAADNVFLALDSANVGLTATGVAENLTLTGGAMLQNNDQVLGVDTRITLDKTTASEVILFVEQGAALFDCTANFLDVLNGAELDMSGGYLRVNTTITVSAASSITGAGIVAVGTGANAQLVNDGTIAPDGGLLDLRRAVGSTAAFDLDGTSGDGVLDVTQGDADLVVRGPLNDEFNGTLRIGDGNTATFENGFTLSTGGAFANLLQMTGGAAGPATLDGLSSVIQGNVEVGGNATIDTDTIAFAQTADVQVDFDGVLNLNGVTTFQGGLYSGFGQISQNVNANFVGDTTIDTAVYDMDGDSGTTQISITNNASVVLSVDAVDDVGSNVFNGTLTLDDGQLQIDTLNNEWTIDGTLNMDGTEGSNVISGDKLFLTGTTNVTGPTPSQVQSDVEFSANSVVNVDLGAEFDLAGLTTYNGGSYSGPGIINQYGDMIVSGSTTLGVGTFNLDGFGSSLVNLGPDVALTIDVDAIDVGDNVFDGTLNTQSSRLTVHTSSGNWTMNGTLNLFQATANPSRVGGGLMIVQGDVNVSGVALIEAPSEYKPSSVVTLDGGLAVLMADSVVSGGTFQGNGTLVNNTLMSITASSNFNLGAFDLDGDNETGSLLVTTGAIASVVADSIDDDNGGFDSLITIQNGARLSITTPSAWELNGTLRLEGPTARLAGQDFGVTSPTARIEGNGLVLASVSNAGAISPGFSAGALTFGDTLILQGASSLEIEIGGAAPALYDRVTVGSTAELGGDLELSLIDGFAPQYGDVYTILTTTFGLGECFDAIVGMDIDGPLVLAVDYTDVAVLVRPTIPGDGNFDGRVTGADFTIWSDNFGAMCPDFGMGDYNGDGHVTGADFTIWSDHFGQMAAPAAAVPEPASIVLAAAAALFVTTLARRKRA